MKGYECARTMNRKENRNKEYETKMCASKLISKGLYAINK